MKDEASAKKFIDMTSNLQSTFLAQRKVKDANSMGDMKPWEGTANRKDGITTVFIDELSQVKNNRKDKKEMGVMLNFFGTVLEVTEYTETLGYSSSADKLYIDDIKTIGTVFGSRQTKKNGETLNMKNIENIEVVSVEY